MEPIDVSTLPIQWYVVYTYSSYESIVKDSLEKAIEKNGLQDRILDIQIPMEDVVSERKGKHVIVQERKYPGYVFLKMRYANDLWRMVTDTRGVTSFVGPKGYPLPLTEEEVRRMHLEQTVQATNKFKPGDRIKVIDGPLEGFPGEIVEVDLAGNKCRVNLVMFERTTPAELSMSQIDYLVL
ncbi:MAG: transcription termination/antitermination protein NusG [Clostridiales bacterium]|jgi:transcriptional antiterminator NusG|nr:transcription termination/antitermination protein NusG [Clostridiales bacterium]